MPAQPYKPIGLVCTAIGWHQRNNSLDDRPAALELATEQERLRSHEEERRQFRAEMARAARRDAQSRLGKPAHRAAQQVAARRPRAWSPLAQGAKTAAAHAPHACH